MKKTQTTYQPAPNYYDFKANLQWKSKVLDFEREFLAFEGNFEEFLIHKQANNADMVNYRQLLNSLNYLRFLRSRAQKYESAQLNLSGEIDISKINFEL